MEVQVRWRRFVPDARPVIWRSVFQVRWRRFVPDARPVT